MTTAPRHPRVVAAGLGALVIAALSVGLVPMLPAAVGGPLGAWLLLAAFLCLVVMILDSRRVVGAGRTAAGLTVPTGSPVEVVGGPCDGQRWRPADPSSIPDRIWLSSEGSGQGERAHLYVQEVAPDGSLRLRHRPAGTD